MKKSRKHRASSDLSEGDRHAHKYSRHGSHHHGKHLINDVAPYDRKHGNHSRHRHDESPRDGTSSIDRYLSEDRATYKDSKSSDRGYHKHPLADVARPSLNSDDPQPATTHGRDANTARSDSSDEILIKYRASRRLPRSHGGDDIARQIKNIEKAQREALRPLSSESQEVHVHYVPVVTRSASPPQLGQDNSESGAGPVRKSLAQGLSGSDVKTQIKDFTMSWFTKRSAQRPAYDDHDRDRDHHQCPSSPRRAKHERRDKHGKKRVSQPKSTSKFLAPLAQRWVCYKCGKVRSDAIQERHPLRAGKKMQPNWCGKCRVHGELRGRPLDWNGQRHYCWGCGIVRSRKYHCENPIAEGERSTPNYCKRCRELSPSFERNLREVSEMGSEIDLRDQAFRRQMYDASMSDIDEDEDHEIASAPGKENEDPNKPRKLKVSQSFILRHGAVTTKTCSDSSFSSTSEGGGVPIDLLEAMHLDADRARGVSSSKKSKHFRLSGESESHQPPSAESLPGADDGDVEMKDDGCPPATVGGVKKSARRQPLNASKGCQTMPDSPPVLLTSARYQASAAAAAAAAAAATAASVSHAKKVRWSTDPPSCPATADHATTTTGNNSCAQQPYHSDSGFSSDYRSDASLRSVGSARVRLRRPPPGEYSTGSPPEREPTAIPTSGGGTALAGHPGATDHLPTPPASHDQPEADAKVEEDVPGGRCGSPLGFEFRKQGRSPEQQIPNFSRPYQSPKRGMHHTSPSCDPAAETYLPTSTSSNARPPPHHVRQQPQQQHQQHSSSASPLDPGFSSAAYFSDSSTARRGFAGYAAEPTRVDDDDAAAAAAAAALYQQYMNSMNSPDAGARFHHYRHHGGHEWDIPFEGRGQQSYDYRHHYRYPSYPDDNDFGFLAPQNGSAAFDFSDWNGGQADTETKFVRRKKTKNDNNNNNDDDDDDDSDGNDTAAAAAAAAPPPQSSGETPSRSQNWQMYEDEDDEGNDDDATFEIYESGGRQSNNYQWHDSRTTVHHAGSTGPPYHHPSHLATGSHHHHHHHHHHMQQPRNVVTILSIREITSDEELSGNDENDDENENDSSHIQEEEGDDVDSDVDSDDDDDDDDDDDMNIANASNLGSINPT